MRPRNSVTGPLILILIGVLFLVHALSPSFPIGEWLARYWPLLLILWGVIELIEISIRALSSRPVPVNGISGAGWFLVILICIAGLAAYGWQHQGTWWRHVTWERGVEAFGEAHDYSFTPLQREAGVAPRLVLENFRGDAKIVGTDSNEVTVSGHKSIRAFESVDADRANARTPVEVVNRGNSVVIRCNQDKADSRTPVTTDLEISVPKGASVEVTGQSGDFDISSISGDVDISTDDGGVRLQDIGGNVKIDTRRSDLIRCENVNGNVDLRGHGDDVELTKIAGQVTVNGDYTGNVSLRDLAKAVRVESMRTELNVERVPGQIQLERGSLNVQNVVGPVRLTTRATDVSLDGFSNGLDLTVDKGDVDLRPGPAPLGKITVHTRSGDIELALPQSAQFAITASTDHGQIDNEFGEPLKEHTEGSGARLEGNIGAGPDLNLTTDRGTITVRKATAEAATKASVLQ